MSDDRFLPEGAAIATRVARQRWLLLWNCQAAGLADALTLRSDAVAVDVHDTLTIDAHRDTILAGLDDYDRVIVAPGVEALFDLRLGERANVWRLPGLAFTGFHPDACILAQDGALAHGPLGLYHSAIAVAAFRAGRSVAETVALYGRAAYAALGYLDRWDAARNELLRNFAAHGIDLVGAFVRWNRRGVFMHTPNRPKIECLVDLAELLLERAGLPLVASEFLPADGLAAGPGFPVFPEIAERIGQRGSCRFKAADGVPLLDLAGFVDASFACYHAAGGIDVDAVPAAFRGVIARAEAWLRDGGAADVPAAAPRGAASAPMSPPAFAAPVAPSPTDVAWSEIVCDEEALDPPTRHD